MRKRIFFIICRVQLEILGKYTCLPSDTRMALGKANTSPSATNVHSANINGHHGRAQAVVRARHMLMFAECFSRDTRQSHILLSAFKRSLSKAHICWVYYFGAIVFLPLLSTPIAILPSLLLTLQSYPLCSEMKTRFTPTPSTAPNGVKEDNFTLANIPLLCLELCEYALICHYIAPTFQ